MHTKRIIPCLDVNNGRVVKGVNFVDLKDAGDPVEIGRAYDREGADELVFLDITASSDARQTVVDMVRRVAETEPVSEPVGRARAAGRPGSSNAPASSRDTSRCLIRIRGVLSFLCPARRDRAGNRDYVEIITSSPGRVNGKSGPRDALFDFTPPLPETRCPGPGSSCRIPPGSDFARGPP